MYLTLVKRLYTFLLLCICSLQAVAQQDSTITYLKADSNSKDRITFTEVHLKTGWRYYPGDDSALAAPDYNDSALEMVTIGSYSESWAPYFPEKKRHYRGVNWFRKRVYLDSSINHMSLAMTVAHEGASEIYIDGERRFYFGEINGADSTEYYTPADKLNFFKLDGVGEHVIAVRYANFRPVTAEDSAYKIGDVTAFKMKIGEANQMAQTKTLQNSLTDIFLSVLAGIFLMMGAVHFMLWAFRNTDFSNLYASAMFISMALIMYFLKRSISSTDPDYGDFGEKMAVIFAILTFLAMAAFTRQAFSKFNKRFLIPVALAVLGMVTYYFDTEHSDLFMFVAINACLIDASVISVRASKRKVKGAKIIAVFTVIITVCLILFMPAYFLDDELTDPNTGSMIIFLALVMLLIVGLSVIIIGLPIAISAFLANRFANLHQDLLHKLHEVQELSAKTISQEQEKKKMLETEKERLETEVAERTKEIVAEKKKSDDLLLNILPHEVAEELKERGASKAKHFDHVSVIFTDFVNFTKTGERLTPEQLVAELHDCFKAFDNICSKYQIEKIKTIGDAYMAVCGLPSAMEEHAINTVEAAIEIRDFIVARKKQQPDTSFHIRIGVNSGDVVAGIVGVKKFAYDIWGDTVNTAARMESNSEPDKVNISHSTYELVKDYFKCTYRGEIEVKGKGALKMYFVERT